MSSSPEQFADLQSQVPVGTNPAVGDMPISHAALQQRIRELEALCADVYRVAVLQALPDALLTRLWMVAAHGNRPQGFRLDTPEDPPLPDLALIHHPEASARLSPPLPDLPERKTVLVVEDDPAMLDLIVKILSSENYELLSAQSGDDALSQLDGEATLPDLLITDLMMPGLDGRQLAGELRRRVAPLRVLYQTGFTDVLFKQRQELEAGEAFLEKPFTARGLVEAARFALFGTINPAPVRAEPVEESRGMWRIPGLWA